MKLRVQRRSHPSKSESLENKWAEKLSWKHRERHLQTPRGAELQPGKSVHTSNPSTLHDKQDYGTQANPGYVAQASLCLKKEKEAQQKTPLHDVKRQTTDTNRSE